MKTQNQAPWEILLLVGKLDLTNSVNSEKCFRQALKDAENRHGENSPEAGLCMIELSDLLERQGRQAEADVLTRRYRTILCRFARKLNLDI